MNGIPTVQARRGYAVVISDRSGQAAGRDRVAVVRAGQRVETVGEARRASVRVLLRSTHIQQVVPAGPPTIVANANQLRETYLAGSVLSALRAVRTQADGRVIYADNMAVDGAFAVVGVTRHAATEDVPVLVQRRGPLSDINWNWIPNQPVYVGANGVLTQNHDTNSDFWLPIGYAVTPTRLDVGVLFPILH